MSKQFKPKEANEEYSRLQEYAETREHEITLMLEPYIKTTDKCGCLMSRICLILGESVPTSEQDSVIRDLMADVFDFLYEARFFILKGKTLVAFPLARRAYESLSLLHLCALDSEIAKQWASGKKISNQKIRKGLAAYTIGEIEKELKDIYNFYCGLTHPNREMIAYRGLGEGNAYVFGSIAMPNLVVVADYCMKHIDLWFWFCAIISYFYKDKVFSRDPSFKNAYKATTEATKETKEWLVQQYNHLLDEWRNETNIVQPKHI
jgi:hypothetical protein